MSEHHVAPFAPTWLNLRWSAWMPLMAAHPLALAQLPSGAGMYRIRGVDRPEEIISVSWAEAGVREVVERLSRQVHLPVQPYDDPAAPARILWSRRRCGISLEVSGAEISERDRHSQAIERALQYGHTLRE